MLTLVMALAVAKGIRQTLRRDSEEAAAKVGIKWPNDIVVDGKKVCGILTEMSMEQGYIQHIVIGVGINVRKQEFPEEIRDRAAAIDEQCGFRISRSQLIADIMEAFEEDYEIFLRTHDLKRPAGLLCGTSGKSGQGSLRIGSQGRIPWHCQRHQRPGRASGGASGRYHRGSLCRRSIGPRHLWVRGMYSIFRDGRRQDGQPDGKTGIKRPEQIVRDRIETEQDIEVWTRTRSYSAAPTPMRRNIILTKNNLR